MRLGAPSITCNHALSRVLPRERSLRLSPIVSFSSHSHRRREFSVTDGREAPSTPNPQAQDIAVLGGGISGLATAFDLSRAIPHAKIVIYERSKRLGGWLDSEKVQVDGGEVLFEWGPRSIRPDQEGAGAATISLMANMLGPDEVLGIPKTDPASQNRFIYYPDRLARMPSPYGNPITSMFGLAYALVYEPIFAGVFRSLLVEPAVKARPSHIADESVGDFMTRRFGSGIADNLLSAVFHGIYAGDIYKLSARTLLPSLWYAEKRDEGGQGVLLEFLDIFLKGRSLASARSVRARQLAGRDVTEKGNNPAVLPLSRNLEQVSMYTFMTGMEALARKLRECLTNNANITIKTESEVFCPLYDKKSKKIIIVDSRLESARFDYAVTTLRPSSFERLPPHPKDTEQKPHGTTVANQWPKIDKAVTVMVVNLYYANPNLIPSQHRGFGYLIPRSVALEENPERALGVIFGSETSGTRGPNAIQDRPKPPPITDMQKKQTEKFLQQLESEYTELKASMDDPPAGMSKSDPKYKKLEEQTALVDAELQRIRQFKKTVIDQEGLDKQPTHIRIGQDTASGTKLTVMLGGHWWDGWTEADYPSEQEAIQMARNILERHLNITDQPEVAKARLQRDCIPQYEVGWRRHMGKFHQEVLMDLFEGRLKVAGPWWQGGVGVNDCIMRAKEVARDIKDGQDENTGLEHCVGREKWLLRDRRTGRYEEDPYSED